MIDLQEWISDLQSGSGLQSQGNHVKASSVYMAFNVDSAGRLDNL